MRARRSTRYLTHTSVSCCRRQSCSSAGGEAEDLAGALGAGCGAWFQDADRTFYRASGLLQRAEAASGAERTALAREALRLMMQVAACSAEKKHQSYVLEE